LTRCLGLVAALAGALLLPSCAAHAEGGYVVLTNLGPGDPYYRAIGSLQQVRPVGRIVAFAGGDVASARRELRALAPRFVAVVVAPGMIDANFAATMLLLSTEMNDDPYADFAYGFVTGASPDDAVALVSNAARAEREARTLPRRFFAMAQTGSAIGGGKTLLTAMRRYAECFRLDGWETEVVEWQGEGDAAWDRARAGALRLLAGRRLVFIGGHGGPDWAAGLRVGDLEGLDLWPAVVVTGACEAGILDRQHVALPGQPVREVHVDPSRSLALRLISQGVTAYLTSLRANCWDNWVPAVHPLYAGGRSVGEAMQVAYNRRLAIATGPLSLPLLAVGQPAPSEEDWPRTWKRVAHCVLYGDPAFVPFPDAPQQHHGLPESFDPWSAASASR
jgi:hypothetical protein